MMPRPPELQGAVDRFDFPKTTAICSPTAPVSCFRAAIQQPAQRVTSPSRQFAAIWTTVGEGFALQQLAMMRASEQTLQYEVIPGSGDGELEGIAGTSRLTGEADRTHRYEMEYDL
jgi:hypothetical protein